MGKVLHQKEQSLIILDMAKEGNSRRALPRSVERADCSESRAVGAEQRRRRESRETSAVCKI
jgi:hypothetical protein